SVNPARPLTRAFLFPASAKTPPSAGFFVACRRRILQADDSCHEGGRGKRPRPRRHHFFTP
ncbi:hypothetical protein K6W80_39310, partial [Burkholderia contaminans]|uniref:hypothetical protein n=1 Tax=Burkholderia contaminans TaxID=488447 RepID=UPI001C94EF88